MVEITLSNNPQKDLVYIQSMGYIQQFQFSNSSGILLFNNGESLELRLYSLETGNLLYTIVGTINTSTGIIDFSITSTHTTSLGDYEYRIYNIPPVGAEQLLVWGRVAIIPTIYPLNSVESFLASELPQGLILAPEFKIQKSQYWRIFLMGAFNISELDILNDNLWPILAKALIAKLIFYDALLLASKGSLMAFMNSSSTTDTGGSQPVKSITTGPGMVEYFESSSIIKSLFNQNASGISPFDALQNDISILTNKLGITLSIGKPINITITPRLI